VSAALVSARHVVGIKLSSAAALDSMRIVAVCDALMMGLALIDRHLQMRALQAKTLEVSLANAQQNLVLHERSAAWRNVTSWPLIWPMRAAALADATHDLRQAIHALRMTLQQVKEDGAIDATAQRTVDGSFKYLEELVEGHLAAAASIDESKTEAREVRSAQSELRGAQALPVRMVLDNVRDMFIDDAGTKGLHLHVRDCSAHIIADPIALMRVLSHLVSNAVKYTHSGRIVVGCRRREDRLLIEVHDSGPGMEAQELERLMQRHQRVADNSECVEGYGLGLAIVTEIATNSGWGFACRCGVGSGTVASTSVPRMR